MTETAKHPDPDSVAATSPPPEAPTLGEVPKYFDVALHERVQKRHREGLWAELGPQFKDLMLRVRPFHVAAVVARREAAEQAVMARLGLTDAADIPAEDVININRVAVIMAITGCKGYAQPSNSTPFDMDPTNEAGAKLKSTQELAAEAGFATERFSGGIELVHFEGTEDAEHVRLFFQTILHQSMPLLNRLVTISKNLQKVADEEIDRLGEDFVYGPHVEQGLAD